MTEIKLPEGLLRRWDFPSLFDSRTVRLRPIRVSSPLRDRRLAWGVRRHPKLARRIGLELVRPDFYDQLRENLRRFGWRAAEGAFLMPSFLHGRRST